MYEGFLLPAFLNTGCVPSLCVHCGISRELLWNQQSTVNGLYVPFIHRLTCQTLKEKTDRKRPLSSRSLESDSYEIRKPSEVITQSQGRIDAQRFNSEWRFSSEVRWNSETPLILIFSALLLFWTDPSWCPGWDSHHVLPRKAAL